MSQYVGVDDGVGVGLSVVMSECVGVSVLV